MSELKIKISADFRPFLHAAKSWWLMISSYPVVMPPGALVRLNPQLLTKL